jgi:hypothetical protein
MSKRETRRGGQGQSGPVHGHPTIPDTIAVGYTQGQHVLPECDLCQEPLAPQEIATATTYTDPRGVTWPVLAAHPLCAWVLAQGLLQSLRKHGFDYGVPDGARGRGN